MQQVGIFEGCKALNIFSIAKASNTTAANLLRVMKADAIQTIPRTKNRGKMPEIFCSRTLFYLEPKSSNQKKYCPFMIKKNKFNGLLSFSTLQKKFKTPYFKSFY